MPTDPNARRDSALASILSELKGITKLLTAQNKTLEKIETNTRHSKPIRHEYLQRSTFDETGPTGTAAGPSD